MERTPTATDRLKTVGRTSAPLFLETTAVSILANPYINLAGLPKEDGKDYVTIYIFPPQNNNGNGGNYGGYQRGNYGNNQNTNLYRDNGGSRGNMGNINPDPMPLDQPGETKDIPF